MDSAIQYSTLALSLLLALSLAFVLTRVKISPVAAYLLTGIIATTYFGIDFNSSYFSLINSLALNLLAFQIGAGFDVSRIREVFGKAIVIAIVELVLVIMISYYTGIFLLHLGPLGALFIALASIDSSTSIIYKLTGGDKRFDVIIAVTSIEDIEVFFIYSIILGLGGSFSFIKTVSIILEVITASLLVYVFARFFFRRVLFNPSRIEDESVIILLPIVLIFVFAYISQITQVPETLAMILAGIAFASVSGSQKVLKIIAPVQEFALIFFFLSVGSLFQVNADVLSFIGLSLLFSLIKYLSFSVANWVTGAKFVDAFTNGVYMIPLTEFGVIVTLNALEQGLNVYFEYVYAVVVVIVSSIVGTIIGSRRDSVYKFFNRLYTNSKFLLQMDLAISWFNKSVMKNITPVSRSALFKSLVQALFYVIVPFFLFPVVYNAESAILSPLNISFLFYPAYILIAFIAIVLLLRFLVETLRAYHTLLGEIVVRTSKLRSRMIKDFWRGVIDLAGHGTTLFMVISTLFYVALEIPVLAQYVPDFILAPTILLGIILSFIYIRRMRFRSLAKYCILSRRKPKDKEIIKITKNSIMALKKNTKVQEITV